MFFRLSGIESSERVAKMMVEVGAMRLPTRLSTHFTSLPSAQDATTNNDAYESHEAPGLLLATSRLDSFPSLGNLQRGLSQSSMSCFSLNFTFSIFLIQFPRFLSSLLCF